MRPASRPALPLLALTAASALALSALSLRAQAPDKSDKVDKAGDLRATLDRIGEHVAQYYARARSLVCVETVNLQPLTESYSLDGPGRELKYELRVEWDPAAGEDAEAKVVRELLAVGGRPPRPKDKPGCMDPKAVSPESLALLLPARRDGYTFTRAGTGRVDGRPSVMFDYKGTGTQPPSVVWKEDCVTVDLPGRTRGRVWIDAETDDVIRLDEHLIGMFDFPVPRDRSAGGTSEWMSIERADSSVRFRPVQFHDPDETMMLPASIESMTIVRNSGVPRFRTTQTFSAYRRFVTGGRIVKDGS